MTGGADFWSTVPGLGDLARRQAGVVSRDQLRRLRVRPQDVAHQVAAHRWNLVGAEVVVLHRGPMTREARLWAGVLGGPPRTAVGAWTALELHGLRGWHREPLHVVLARGERAQRHPWLVVHESRRPAYDDVVAVQGLPVHTVARAAVDAAAWERLPRSASGLLAAVVQQRLATPDELYDKLDEVGAVRHRRILRHVLADVAGGADSLAEIDFARLCRRAGLPEPSRQVRRQDARGRWRFLDAEWRLPGGRRLVVEIDGIGHMESARWYDDLLRDAELGADTRTVRIRLPATAARCEPDRVLAILRRHLLGPALAA